MSCREVKKQVTLYTTLNVWFFCCNGRGGQSREEVLGSTSEEHRRREELGSTNERSWGALLESTAGEHCWREVLASAVDPASRPGMDPITYSRGFCSSLQLLDEELKLLLVLLEFWPWLIKQKLMAKRK